MKDRVFSLPVRTMTLERLLDVAEQLGLEERVVEGVRRALPSVGLVRMVSVIVATEEDLGRRLVEAASTRVIDLFFYKSVGSAAVKTLIEVQAEDGKAEIECSHWILNPSILRGGSLEVYLMNCRAVGLLFSSPEKTRKAAEIVLRKAKRELLSLVFLIRVGGGGRGDAEDIAEWLRGKVRDARVKLLELDGINKESVRELLTLITAMSFLCSIEKALKTGER